MVEGTLRVSFISCHVPKDGEDDDLKDLVSQLGVSLPLRISNEVTTRLKRNADVGKKACFYILKQLR